MAAYENFYGGTNYGLDPNYGAKIGQGYGNTSGYRLPAGVLGFPSDPGTGNQLKAVSDKLNTGAKVVEVSGVNIGRVPGETMGVINAIPRQHFAEINRLRKLAGAELTFHGPLIELSGITGGPYDEMDREQSERQMWSVVQKGHEMSPKSNIPIVFHASNVGANFEKRMKKEGDEKDKIVEGVIINTETGQLQRAPPEGPEDYWKGKKLDYHERINELNEKQWEQKLQQVNFSVEQAIGGVEKVERLFRDTLDSEEDAKKYLNLYKDYIKNPEKSEKFMQSLSVPEQKVFKEVLQNYTLSDNYIKDTYNKFKEYYNEAYGYAKKNELTEDKKKLDHLRDRFTKQIHELEDDPSKIDELGNLVLEGVATLRKIDKPKLFQPARDFMIDKASETISNVAMKSYKEWGDNSPVIAIENPPADKFSLSRADELVKLMDTSRKQFTDKAIKSKSEGGLGLSKSEAKKAAEKFIGLTWDTAHINMIRSLGYTKEDVIKEAGKAARYVKHVHISDNFGLGDEELPPGWGSSPIQQQLKMIEDANLETKDKIKKIMEAGSWYSALQQKHTPMLETLSAFGSPIYSMQMSPTWNQAAVSFGGYYSGIGATNPDFHHSLYGAGFTNMPIELGGQIAGRSRAGGGTPFE